MLKAIICKQDYEKTKWIGMLWNSSFSLCQEAPKGPEVQRLSLSLVRPLPDALWHPPSISVSVNRCGSDTLVDAVYSRWWGVWFGFDHKNQHCARRQNIHHCEPNTRQTVLAFLKAEAGSTNPETVVTVRERCGLVHPLWLNTPLVSKQGTCRRVSCKMILLS